MHVTYKTKKLEKICTVAHTAQKEYGIRMAEKINQRIGEIKASDNVNEMIEFNLGRCHALKGNRKNQFAVDLVHPYRLVFEELNNEIVIANILEIIDYH